MNSRAVSNQLVDSSSPAQLTGNMARSKGSSAWWYSALSRDAVSILEINSSGGKRLYSPHAFRVEMIDQARRADRLKASWSCRGCSRAGPPPACASACRANAPPRLSHSTSEKWFCFSQSSGASERRSSISFASSGKKLRRKNRLQWFMDGVIKSCGQCGLHRLRIKSRSHCHSEPNEESLFELCTSKVTRRDSSLRSE